MGTSVKSRAMAVFISIVLRSFIVYAVASTFGGYMTRITSLSSEQKFFFRTAMILSSGVFVVLGYLARRWLQRRDATQ